jgi:hypothetical protein
MAETARLGVSELRREFADHRRENREQFRKLGFAAKILAGITGLAAVAIPVWGQIQVASISAATQAQAAAVAARTVERDDDLVRRIAAELSSTSSSKAEERAREAVRVEMATLRRDIDERMARR